MPITQPLDARPVQGLDPIGPEAGLTEILALDCEMVGTGPRGATSELARSACLHQAPALLAGHVPPSVAGCLCPACSCSSASRISDKPRRPAPARTSTWIPSSHAALNPWLNQWATSLSRQRRVSVVNDSGVVVLDLFVKPVSRVTDYRTRYSGVRARDLVGAPSAEEVRPRVARMLAGRLLVGHALHNDLKVRAPYPRPGEWRAGCCPLLGGHGQHVSELSSLMAGRGGRTRLEMRDHVMGMGTW